MYVLVVEDSAPLRLELEQWLAEAGHAICWASTGAGAIRQLCMEGDRIDLVLLDMILEDPMTGWDVARFMYFDPKLRKIPVIVVTGLSSRDVHEQARTNVLADIVGIVRKPLDHAHLAALIAVAESKRR